MNTYVTSDTHFFHKNIIQYSNRPYKDVLEMNEALISNWNEVVKSGDTCWMLGDFIFGDINQAIDVIKRLNGHKYFLRGNHDKVLDNNKELLSTFIDGYTDYHQFKDHKMVAFHYPLFQWDKCHHGHSQIHGHCHNSIFEANKDKRRIDVGVDSEEIPRKYYPTNIEDIKAICHKRPITQHHFDNHKDSSGY